MDLTSVPDPEFQFEANRRSQLKAKEYQEQLADRYRREREAKEARDREFATEVGITWEQFQEVDAWVRDNVYEEQR